MKVSGRIDGSIRGAILSTRQSSSAPSARLRRSESRRPGYAAAAPGSRRGAGPFDPEAHLDGRRESATPAPLPKRRLHNTFFRPSLSPACEHHTAAAVAATPTSTSTGPAPSTVPPSPPPSSPSPPPPSPPPPPTWSTEELLALVDQQDAGTVEEHLRFARDPYLRGYAPSDGPNLVVSNRRDDVNYPSADELIRADGPEQEILRELQAAVASRLRRPTRGATASTAVSLESVYQTYRRLPEPRMGYMPAQLRHQLLRVLGRPQKRDAGSMLRYFAAIADAKNSGLPLTRAEWNSALSLASRYVGRSTSAETEAALGLWREMERDAGVRGNDVTFNILFDVASKAGNFALAEMIYREMEHRGYAFNRYHYVSLIHFFGLKLDANGVRAAYREMVHAGEIIDTVALNSVLSGLLRSGEEEAADRVYERMKAAAAAAAAPKPTALSRGLDTPFPTASPPPRDYSANKMITKALMMFARVGRSHPPMRPAFQSVAPLAPDLQTYRLLINHYGVRLGDLGRVARYLDEMKQFGVPLHGAIFLALFKGFCTHGGFPGSAWSGRRLDGIWDAFLQALDGGAAGLRIETWLAMWALRAFDKCSPGDKVMRAYEALEARWDLDHASSRFMMDFLHNTLNKSSARDSARN